MSELNTFPIKREDFEGKENNLENKVSGHIAMQMDKEMTAINYGGINVDLFELVRKVDGKPLNLFEDEEDAVLRAIRDGLCIQNYMFNKVTGLKAGLITPTDKDASALKNRSILLNLHAMYVATGYVISKLQKAAEEYNKEKPNNFNLPSIMVSPENVSTNSKARLYNVGKFAESISLAAEKKEIKDAKDLLNYSIKYFEKLGEGIKTAMEDYRFVKFQGSDQTIMNDIENTVFDIEGIHFKGFSYESTASTKQKSIIEFKNVEPDEVIGNDLAKKQMLRDIDRLVLYDFEKKMNPMVKVYNVLPWSTLLDGLPGTGKTTMMQMEMTKLKKICDMLKIPFRLFVIDANEKDSFYGNTQAKYRAKLNETLNPGFLGLVYFDDVDLIIPGRQSASMNSADQDVLKLFMDYLAGAETDIKGNVITRAATNNAMSLDPAFRQRFRQRYYINGPVTAEQAAALMYVKFSKLTKLGLTDIPLGKGFDPKKLQSAYEKVTQEELSDETKQILATLKITNTNSVTWMDFGNICHEYQKINERFTGRFIDNVASNVMTTSADFDLDKDVFEKPEVYFQKSWDDKVNYLRGYFKKVEGDTIVHELDRYFKSEMRYMQSDQEQALERSYTAQRTDMLATTRLKKELADNNSTLSISIRQIIGEESK
jgi:AAA+ superfamily predicted ATPase